MREIYFCDAAAVWSLRRSKLLVLFELSIVMEIIQICIIFTFLNLVKSEFCYKKSKVQKGDSIFYGKIEEFFGQTSALFKVIKVHQGNQKHQNNFVIVEGFQNCPNQNSVKIQDEVLIFIKPSEPGIFQLQSYPRKSRQRQLRSFYSGI